MRAERLGQGGKERERARENGEEEEEERRRKQRMKSVGRHNTHGGGGGGRGGGDAAVQQRGVTRGWCGEVIRRGSFALSTVISAQSDKKEKLAANAGGGEVV